MRIRILLLASLAAWAVAAPVHASEEAWLVEIDRWGNAEYRTLTLDASGTGLAGRLGDWVVTGSEQGGRLRFSAVDGHGHRHDFDAVRTPDALTGTADFPDTNDPAARAQHAFTARRLALPPADDAARTLVHQPRDYSNEFTAHRAPVLVIRPGDIVSTQTIDSGGVDAAGRTRALYGNPQTGPFFVAGAEPGDVLAVRIRKLDVNRDHADSLDGFVARAMTGGLATKAVDLGQRMRWRLDRQARLARPENPPAVLADFAVPLRPMLGGIGVAPDFGFAPASAGDSGRFGGNIDYNGIVEGVTVYLPVFQPGAMLYLGDGHALQGDGETTQWALETSLDVEFSVEVLPPRPLAAPRVESADRITVIGQAGSLDDALRSATAAMVQWLEQDRGLDVRSSSLVLGTLAEYRVVTLAGRNAGIALSLPKALLPAAMAPAARAPEGARR